MHTGRKNDVVFANFQKAYNEFIALEYQSEAEDLSQSNSVDILYTEELDDYFDYLEYQLQISYDIVNQQEITIYENVYLTFQYKDNMTMELESENLTASFGDWMNAIPVNRSDLTAFTLLIVLGIDETVAKERLGLNNLEISYKVKGLENEIELLDFDNQQLEEHLSEVMGIPYSEMYHRKIIEASLTDYKIEVLETMTRTEKYDERLLLNSAKEYDKSWKELIKHINDFMAHCSFVVQEESYESYLFSGGQSKVNYIYDKQKLLKLVLIDLEKELEEEEREV